MATILITGTSRGLGLEFVRQYAARGDSVIATARALEHAQELQDIAARAGGNVELHDVDVTSRPTMDALKSSLGSRPLDILINNAGVLYRNDGLPVDYDSWHDAFLVNALAPVYMASLFAENLRAGGLRKLVTITSHMASFAQGGGGVLSYRASKAAVNRAMLGLAAELRHDGITVAVFHPGWVRTDMGGASAAITPAQSVTSLIQQFAALNSKHSGGFFNYNGSRMEW